MVLPPRQRLISRVSLRTESKIHAEFDLGMWVTNEQKCTESRKIRGDAENSIVIALTDSGFEIAEGWGSKNFLSMGRCVRAFSRGT